MKYKRIIGMFFSPTGATERIAGTISATLGDDLGLPTANINFTMLRERQAAYQFSADDIVVFGTPVYAGRVPNILLPFLKTITGSGAIAIPVVTFGNRAFDDALIELRDILIGGGFKVIAAGAFAGAHSFSVTLGAGRPDTSDLALARQLGLKAAAKLTAGPIAEDTVKVSGTEAPYRPYFQPRDREGNPINILKVKPKTLASCTDCKLCVTICPMSSIDSIDVTAITGICIKCGACIKRCPQKAKYIDDPGYMEHVRDLEETYQSPARSEIFY